MRGAGLSVRAGYGHPKPNPILNPVSDPMHNPYIRKEYMSKQKVSREGDRSRILTNLAQNHLF